MALMVGAPPPGTSTTSGSGTWSKVWSAITLSGPSVGRGSIRSATTTGRYWSLNCRRLEKTCSGPTRSSSVMPGYSTNATVFCAWVAIVCPSTATRWLLEADKDVGTQHQVIAQAARHPPPRHRRVDPTPVMNQVPQPVTEVPGGQEPGRLA